MNVRRRVNRGVGLLDKHAPGWENRVNVSQLDMSDTSDCLLGQLFGSYERGLTALFGDHWPLLVDSEDGFDIENGFDVGGSWAVTMRYEVLTRRWREVIQGRRALTLLEVINEVRAKRALADQKEGELTHV